MNWHTALRLGRVSNLPTVWTNTLAGAVLAGATGFGLKMALMLIAFSLFYVGGMFLNDAFDADIDAKERPERPIPSGLVSQQEVFRVSLTMMAAGLFLLLGIGFGYAFRPGTGIWPVLGGLALSASIVFYNSDHKNNRFSPFVMGLCRVFVYVAAALCFVPYLSGAILTAVVLILSYLIGLTYIAKQENLGEVKNMWPLLFLAVPVIWGAWSIAGTGTGFLFWLAFTGWLVYAVLLLKRRRAGDIPKAVVSLIAGICLLDAMLIIASGGLSLALLALIGFALTLLFQRFIAGT